MTNSVDNKLTTFGYTQLVINALQLKSHEYPKLIVGTGLPQSIMQTKDEIYITSKQVLQILHNTIQLAPTPDIGLIIGRKMHPGTHGPVGHLIFSCTNLLTALNAFCRFIPIRIPFLKTQLTVSNNHIECNAEVGDYIPPTIGRAILEGFSVIVQSIARFILNRELTEGHFYYQFEKPSYAKLYKQHIYSPISFDADKTKVVIPYELANSPNAFADSHAFDAVLPICEKLQEQTSNPDDTVSNIVEEILLSSQLGSLTADEVAAIMHITKRTLQRKLKQEGNSFRGICESINSDLAAHHLTNSHMTVQSIAMQLGYNDPAAFRKAFSRWYGTSPSAFRASHKR